MKKSIKDLKPGDYIYAEESWTASYSNASSNPCGEIPLGDRPTYLCLVVSVECDDVQYRVVYLHSGKLYYTWTTSRCTFEEEESVAVIDERRLVGRFSRHEESLVR